MVFKQGKENPMYGVKRKGAKNPFFGKKHSKETIEKIRRSKLGKKHSLKHKQKISKALKGKVAWNRGLTFPGRWKSNSREAKKHRFMITLHRWIHKNKPKPQFCEDCNEKPPYDCANISGKYKKDINDFKWLCRKCHLISDGRIINNLTYRRK